MSALHLPRPLLQAKDCSAISRRIISVNSCRITRISRYMGCPTMPNNRLDPTSILLRSYLCKTIYTSVASTHRQQPWTIFEYNPLFCFSFVSLVSLPIVRQLELTLGRSTAKGCSWSFHHDWILKLYEVLRFTTFEDLTYIRLKIQPGPKHRVFQAKNFSTIGGVPTVELGRLIERTSRSCSCGSSRPLNVAIASKGSRNREKCLQPTPRCTRGRLMLLLLV
jgi:hypothetical protein